MKEKYKRTMGLRLLRIIILLWIGWYLTGPIAETVDRWDGPRQEMHDILFNAGGGVTLFACTFCVAVRQAKKLRERCSLPLGAFRRQPSSLGRFSPALLLVSPRAAAHSPPLPLRI